LTVARSCADNFARHAADGSADAAHEAETLVRKFCQAFEDWRERHADLGAASADAREAFLIYLDRRMGRARR
jgi:hypothetical protein